MGNAGGFEIYFGKHQRNNNIDLASYKMEVHTKQFLGSSSNWVWEIADSGFHSHAPCSNQWTNSVKENLYITVAIFTKYSFVYM